MTTPTRTPAAIDTSALRELTKDGSGPRLLDVRTPGEFHTVHIPGAYNAPLDTLREYRAELLHHLDEDTVLICRSGARAAQAEQALSDAGLPNLRVLQGGMAAWEAAKGPVTRRAARWELERQVRLIAGSIVLVSGLAGLAIPGLHLIGTAVGAGLTFAAVTNTCAMGMLLAKLPYNRGPRTDINSVIAALRSRP
ncbi:rhodanese-related sulfurtransferase [Kitasatospora sp. MAA19]|uniref:rhodanese-like domain-containing protein n=1 Tax=Kitasatospora sp. MAA19 TaxID=3035090 RepID=UPI00247635B4|nr:rhodanese-like domain-containing protein [Kitasatospora sp. MAA19]MDH6710082.1 rhodanese-related sulfurtransferase [Kitasatospora sp. MAA19]